MSQGNGPIGGAVSRKYTDDERVVAFWEKVEFTETCWLWKANQNSGGYGMFWSGGSSTVAHRYAYEFCVGPIPDGLQIDHLCRVRNCIRPDHLEIVTQQENVRRGEDGKRNREKTYCPQRHPYDEQNTYRSPNGDRLCRKCQTAHKRAWRRRHGKARPQEGVRGATQGAR